MGYVSVGGGSRKPKVYRQGPDTNVHTDVLSQVKNIPAVHHQRSDRHSSTLQSKPATFQSKPAALQSSPRNVPVESCDVAVDLLQRCSRPPATFQSTSRNVPVDLPQRCSRPPATFQSPPRNVAVETCNVAVDPPQRSSRPPAALQPATTTSQSVSTTLRSAT